MRKIYTVLILVVGGFVIYNLVIVLWAFSYSTPVRQIAVLARYAPWLVYIWKGLK